MLRSVIHAVGKTNWKKFAVSIFPCPLCGGKRVFVRLDESEISVRCFSCRATTVTLSLVTVLRQVAPHLGSKHIYELSSRGPLFKYLKQKSGTLVSSEYFSDVPPGDYKGGVQCQDVQRLTYENESFDICTSTEVFEHVPDDSTGFSEICRVLKPDGIFIFSVPIDIDNMTVERAKIAAGGKINYLLPAQYHGDPLRGIILAFRNYGYDILDRLLDSGFAKAEIRSPGRDMAWGYARPIIVAYRDMHLNDRGASDILLRSRSRQ